MAAREIAHGICSYNYGPVQPDPGVWMQFFLSTETTGRANKWQGRNITRWRNAAWDDLYHAAQATLDPVKRAAMFIEMNDIVVNQRVVIPIVYRPGVSAANLRLHVSPQWLGQQFLGSARLVHGRLVPRVVHSAGYNRFSFTRASAVVNCQSALTCLRLRVCSQAATSSMRLSVSGMRRSRH